MTRNVRTAMSWCLKNDIKIIIKPLSKTGKPDALIEIHMQGKIQIGKEIYRQDKKLGHKIQELYLYLYKTLR
tara:strand:- start:27 stop:242 length:216 start_codon:yes stop_codon:yes gene_type:complete